MFVWFSFRNHGEEAVEVVHLGLSGPLPQIVHGAQRGDFLRQRIGDELIDGNLIALGKLADGAVQGLRQAELTLARCGRSARQDVALAVALLREGLSGARVSLEQKLNALTDETYARAVVEEVGRLSEEGHRAANAAASLSRELPA